MTESLSEEQKEIVELSSDTKALVTAGAGTGKTYVLIARLNELINTFGLAHGGEILVLSFSRSAVKEIRDRVKEQPGYVKYVRAITFDSFGTRLLSEFDPGGDWENVGFDERIERAVQLIKSNEEARVYISQYGHILVDEIQDLVGIRADMVKAFLGISECGFTLLGDPAQGIYNFSLTGEDRIEGSAKLYKWLRQHYGDELKEFTLSENKRALTDVVKKVLWAGPKLNAPNPDYEAIKYKLETDVFRLPPLLQPNDISKYKPIQGRTAFLCQTNGQALVLSKQLWEAGIGHSYQRSATDRVLPAWIGKLFSGFGQNKIGKSRFVERFKEKFGGDPELAWNDLKRIESSNLKDTLDLTKLAECIRAGNILGDLYSRASGNIVVSTVHRAKGLEFERVVVVQHTDSSNIKDDQSNVPEETRTLYVALTRPTSELYSLSHLKFSGHIRKEKRSGRWIRQVRKYVYEDIEIEGDDVHRLDPAGGFGVEEANPKDIQEFITDKVRIGEEVHLIRVPNRENSHPEYLYEIQYTGQTVGMMSESFSHVLYNTLKRNRNWEVNWPLRIEGTRVEAIDTVAGPPNSGSQAGLADPDIWQRVRVAGFGSMIFARWKKDPN